jgi:nicotinate-nucleotide pyrophosphorylase (carboxylating)
MKITKDDYYPLIKTALREDLGKIGDATSSAIFDREESAYKLIAKESGILCGAEIFTESFLFTDKKIKIKFNYKDGAPLKKGEAVAVVSGNVHNILAAERTALNFIALLSGVATKTSLFVTATKGKIRILDTRKTIPGFRMLEKYAVACGGGVNHRIGLYDMVLIKDNHIDAAGGIEKAVEKVRKKWGKKFKIEVETRNLAEVEETLKLKVNRIMLDNMNYSLMTKAVKLINKKCEVEISGNVTLKRIKKLSKLGADFVSIGELTHTVKAFDFSLVKEK